MNLINKFNCIIWTLLYCFVKLDVSLALRDVRVQIPHAVRKGEKAILKCLYDLEGDSLYSVKWYKGRREFYSFTPKETPAMKVFQFAGVKVDRSSSNESQLVLEAVNAATSGKYSCEVSADAPSFHTLIGAGELDVVVPGKDPVITGIRSRYKVGDIVKGNCTSSHSRPAANITWTVNGYETNPAHVRHFRPHKDPRELETVISAIHFVVTPQHFIYGKLKIRCTAFIHDVYWKSTEKSVEENRLNKAGSSNVVHKFSEDYFDLEEDNVVDRSDTYMTHIKGDVSSLNASGCSALHKCSCFWPRLTTLSLILYAVQQLLQLLQQLLTQTTQTTTQATTTAKQNTSNCRTIKTYENTSKNNNKEENKNLLKITEATITTVKGEALKQHTSRSSATQVAAICYKNMRQQQRQIENKLQADESEEYWPKEKHSQIKLIKQEQQQQQQQQQRLAYRLEQENNKNWQQFSFKYTNTSVCKSYKNGSHHHKQQQQLQLQLHLYLHLQPVCDKTLYDSYNSQMTTTIQVANILPANNNANLSKHVSTRPIFNTKEFTCRKAVSSAFSSTSFSTSSSATSHNFKALNVATTSEPYKYFVFVLNSLNTATCLNTCTCAGNLTSNEFFLILTTTATTAKTITT